jgi:hypothetical protein
MQLVYFTLYFSAIYSKPLLNLLWRFQIRGGMYIEVMPN